MSKVISSNGVTTLSLDTFEAKLLIRELALTLDNIDDRIAQVSGTSLNYIADSLENDRIRVDQIRRRLAARMEYS
jgi:hypothetical protein